MKKMSKKCSTDQRFIRKRNTTYKIGTLTLSTRNMKILQGLPLGIDIMYLVLGNRNMQVRFGLKVVWES